MQLTVKQLIDKLQEFLPSDAAIVLEDLDDDQEFFITSFNAGDGRLTIVITDKEEEEDEEQKEEEEKEYG
ncbi:hypothetical protein [Nostoc sp.]|uniref:hypothetical protein n=1 Tax=Nostoc sp. TaxID=1180 RepID=UPI002FF55B3F